MLDLQTRGSMALNLASALVLSLSETTFPEAAIAGTFGIQKPLSHQGGKALEAMPIGQLVFFAWGELCRGKRLTTGLPATVLLTGPEGRASDASKFASMLAHESVTHRCMLLQLSDESCPAHSACCALHLQRMQSSWQTSTGGACVIT